MAGPGRGDDPRAQLAGATAEKGVVECRRANPAAPRAHRPRSAARAAASAESAKNEHDRKAHRRAASPASLLHAVRQTPSLSAAARGPAEASRHMETAAIASGTDAGE